MVITRQHLKGILLKGIVRLPVSILARNLGMLGIAATFLPYRGARSYALPRGDASEHRGPRLPVPPQDLWLGYGSTSDGYLASGKEDLEKLSGGCPLVRI